MIHSYRGMTPDIDPSAFIAPTAAILGNVKIEADASIWFGAVLRGDECSITIGEGSNVQDNATLHGYSPSGCDVVLGKRVTVGHNAVVHGCRIADDTLVGMGAIILNGAQIGSHCIIAAGALIKENAQIPDYSLVVGVPGKIVRTMTPEQTGDIGRIANDYLNLGREFREELKGE